MAERRASGSISWTTFAAATAGVATTLALIYMLDAAVQKRADDHASNETLRSVGTRGRQHVVRFSA